MTWFTIYIVIGTLNALVFHVREGFDEALEICFFILFWPLQALFWTVVGIHNLSESILSRLFR